MKVSAVTIDRTINLPFLVTVFLALLAAGAWTSTVNARLTALDERTRGISNMQEHVARIDERSEATKASLARIERQLERDAP